MFDQAEVSNPCPACRSTGLRTFYGPLRLPTQSNRLLRTANEAACQPTATLHLAHCRACGFITNIAFDSASQALDDDYEATQGHSPTFNRFATSLARQWIDRYELGRDRNRQTALEIGCGHGEFLGLLSDLCGCDCIGIDPIAGPSKSTEILSFYRCLWNDSPVDLKFDFICCRHTLEHIPDVRAFVSSIRARLENRPDIPVCFEVPDTLRVLREGAFWDIYCEHCSYFTRSSIAHLFRACGFDVVDARLEYDEQYIVLEAVAGPRAQQNDSIESNDADDIACAIDTFRRSCIEKMSYWRNLLEGAASGGRHVALWGAGSKAAGFLTTLDVKRALVRHVVDINPHKQGTFIPMTGQTIVAPDELCADPPAMVIAMNPIYRDEIRGALDAMGLTNTQLLAL